MCLSTPGTLEFLEILRLLEDFLVHLVPVHRRVAVFGQEDDQVDHFVSAMKTIFQEIVHFLERKFPGRVAASDVKLFDGLTVFIF